MYDAHRVTPEIADALQPYVSDPLQVNDLDY